RLAEEERQLRQRLRDNVAAFTSQGAALRSLLARVAGHGALSAVQLLAQIKHFYARDDREASPPLFSIALRREPCSFPPQYSALRRIRREFRVDVVLDPQTASPSLQVAADGRSVSFAGKRPSGPRAPRRPAARPVVLGLPDFRSGRHFWQVEVGDTPQWAVGVCRASLSPRARQAGQGCWRLQLQDGGYDAAGARPGRLQLDVRDRTLGVFLDYELGEVSFYDMPEGAHICTFRDSFSGALQPYFYVGPGSKPLSVPRERLCE
ncbi:PREDICTED: putative tripartite motif-containing protein 75, partial [Chinchilla lanigera]|uniref:putative tripartite motif-containing protein 75 n=1 Tax=Chinchilla lanigera TaxID=34839 RepID=UPI00069800BF